MKAKQVQALMRVARLAKDYGRQVMASDAQEAIRDAERDYERLRMTLEHAVQMLEKIQRGGSYEAMDYLTRVANYRDVLKGVQS